MGRKTHQEEEVQVNTGTQCFWIFACILVIGAACVHIAAMVLNQWRNADPINYVYQYRGQSYNQQIGAVNYGLYKISFDSGTTIITWNSRVSSCKVKGDAAIQLGQSGFNGPGASSYASDCPFPCQEALKTRYTAYKRIQQISLSLLGTMALSGCIGLIGVACYFLLGKKPYLLVFLWISPGVATLAVGGYWLWETNEAFLMISNSQQYPYPSIGICWYLLLTGCGSYCLASVLVLIIGAIDKHIKNREANKAFHAQLMESQNDMMMPMPMNRMSQMGPIGPMGLMGGIGHMGGISPMGQMNQMGQIGQIGQVGQISQMNAFGDLGYMGAPTCARGCPPLKGMMLNPMGGSPSFVGKDGAMLATSRGGISFGNVPQGSPRLSVGDQIFPPQMLGYSTQGAHKRFSASPF